MEAKKRVGMYGETPMVKVGKFEICRQNDESVWIEDTTTSEGAQFPDDLFESAVAAFFAENF